MYNNLAEKRIALNGGIFYEILKDQTYSFFFLDFLKSLIDKKDEIFFWSILCRTLYIVRPFIVFSQHYFSDTKDGYN